MSRVVLKPFKPDKGYGISTYGFATIYHRIALPALLSLALYVGGSDNVKNEVSKHNFFDKSFRIDERSREICKCFVDLLKKSTECLERVLHVIKKGLVREARWEELLENVAPHSKSILVEFKERLLSIETLGNALEKLLELSEYPELLYVTHAATVLKALSSSKEDEECIERICTLLNEMYNCFTRLYSLRIEDSSESKPLPQQLANELSIPVTFKPSPYYLLAYIDADNASDVFAGSKGVYAGLIGASYYQYLALNSVLNTLTLDSADVIVPIQPFYMAGDDHLVIAPLEVFVPFTDAVTNIIRRLGLDYSAVLIAAHVHTPLREAIRTAWNLMTEVAKKTWVVSINAKKNSLVFARITSSGELTMSVLPLKLVDYRTATRILYRLLNMVALRKRFRGESLYALLRKTIEAYYDQRLVEDYELYRYELLKSLMEEGYEELAIELSKLMHDEKVVVPYHSSGSTMRLNPGIELLRIVIAFRTILPYTVWPERWEPCQSSI